MLVIDPHLHLFDLTLGHYSWLKPENAPNWPDKHQICRNYSERDLKLNNGLELAGYVHIEAGFDNAASWRETEWLEQQALIPLRSVAHLDLRLPAEDFSEGLHKLQQQSTVVGVRQILDDRAEQILTHANTGANLDLLTQYNLHFELQFEMQNAKKLDCIKETLDNHPQLHFILNHGGFSTIDPESPEFKPGITRLRSLAQHNNLSVKASGFEMGDRNFQIEQATRFCGALCELFGEDRVMLGSNFPLITLSMAYNTYWQRITEALEREGLPLAPLVYQNAKRIYRFN